MARVQSKPLVRITIQRRRTGWCFVVVDRNNIESDRGLFDNLQTCAVAAFGSFRVTFPGETLFADQVSVPRNVYVPADLNQRR